MSRDKTIHGSWSISAALSRESTFTPYTSLSTVVVVLFLPYLFLFIPVCSKDLTTVNKLLFVSARNGINYFALSVHQDHLTVKKLLMNTDVSFSIQVTLNNGNVVEKRFGIETNYTSRTKRWSPYSYWNIHSPHLFRNYNQHSCCGCYSGCGPVAWAQIFAYYDR